MKTNELTNFGENRSKRLFCPKCESEDTFYNAADKSYHCICCDTTWSEDVYIKVEHPDDISYFEQEEIGYPAYNSEDNGARYVPEYEYILQFGKQPNKNSYYKPIRWPESQKYLELQDEEESAFELCETIETGEKALEDFGDSSIWVPECIIDKEKQIIKQQ